MTQQATIRGTVCYRVGDGAAQPIPPGPVEVDASADSVTLSWTASNDAAGSAALTRGEYDQYVKDGGIVLAGS